MYADLKGKTAFINGAGKRTGLGYAIADKLAASGANVVVADICLGQVTGAELTSSSFADLESIAAEIAEKHGVTALAVRQDVTDKDSVAESAAKVKEQFGRLDVLVNNAGSAFGAPAPTINYDEAAWMKTFDINYYGVFRVSRAMLPLMFGAPASIVNMASKAGKAAVAMNGAYCVSKAAVIMLTRVMAKEMAPANIRVNALCPGLIMTDMQRFRIKKESEVFGRTFEQQEKELGKLVPMGYLAQPSQVADLAAYLASAESSYITGQAINVDGGQLTEA
jgi:NAD(P)-dependent dehydrogenase (short-subunit alcohol dehydrogenase family)